MTIMSTGMRPLISVFDPTSIESKNLAALARLEKLAPSLIPPIRVMDLESSCELARLLKGGAVPDEVRAGASSMLRRSVHGVTAALVGAKAVVMPGVAKEDLLQEAALAVMNSVDLYDPNNPDRPDCRVPFWGYAYRSVLRAIRNYGDSSDSEIRRPVYMRDLIRRIASSELFLSRQTGSKPTDEEIAEFLEITVEQVKKARDASRIGKVSSTDEPIGEEKKTTLLDRLSGREQVRDEPDLPNVGREELRTGLTYLNWIQREVVTLYFGLDNGHPLTLRELGVVFDLSAERIRLIKLTSLAALRRIIAQREHGLEMRRPQGSHRDAKGSEEPLPFFESRMAIVRAESQARMTMGRDVTTAVIAKQLGRTEYAVIKQIREDPVLLRRKRPLIDRPADVSWSDWIRRFVDVAFEQARSENRPLIRPDIWGTAACSETRFWTVLRDDEGLEEYIQQRTEEIVYWTRQTRIQAAAESLRKKLKLVPEAALPTERLCEEMGIEPSTFWAWRVKAREQGRDLIPPGCRINERRPNGFNFSLEVRRDPEKAAVVVKQAVAEAVQRIMARPLEERNLSVEGIADEIGVDPLTLARWNKKYGKGRLYPETFCDKPSRWKVEPIPSSLDPIVRRARGTEILAAYHRAIGKLPEGQVLTLDVLVTEWGRSRETMRRWCRDDEDLVRIRRCPSGLHLYEVLGVGEPFTD